MTGEKDPRDVMPGSEPGMATASKMEVVQPAPAEMPGVEEIHAAFVEAQRQYRAERDAALAKQGYWPDRSPAPLDVLAKVAQALFAPILAEKERLEAANAKRKEFGKWLDDLAENPPPPSEALKKLLADYKASGIKSVGLDSPFNACCYRDQCKALEARALAAEAALAAERERCAKIADRESVRADGMYSAGEARGIARATADHIAAAIRAQE